MPDKKKSAHPMQPILVAPDGVLRFRRNKVVRYLLDEASKLGLDLNHLAKQRFDDEEMAQFYQLIGTSVSGWGDLDCVSDEMYEAIDPRDREWAKGQG